MTRLEYMSIDKEQHVSLSAKEYTSFPYNEKASMAEATTASSEPNFRRAW